MTTDNPSTGLFAMLEAALPGSTTPGYGRASHGTSHWTPICICGHQGSLHGEEYGGDRPFDEYNAVNIVLPCCTGPLFRRPQRKNPALASSTFTDGVRIALDADGNQVPAMVYSTKCFCEKFTPVAEVDRPGVAFRRVGAMGDHALSAGIRALASTIRNRGIQDPDAPPVPKRRITPTNEQLEQIVEARFRWLVSDDERRCAKCGASATTKPPLFLVYSDLPVGQHSEFRCTDCQP